MATLEATLRTIHQASGLAVESAPKQISTLLYCMGPDAEDMLQTTGITQQLTELRVMTHQSTATSHAEKSLHKMRKGVLHAQAECPARDATCHRCGKRGHFSTQCLTKLKSISQVQVDGAEATVDHSRLLDAVSKELEMQEPT